MADFSLPSLSLEYEAFINAIKANDASVARWFDKTTDTNIPTEAKGWSAANKRFEMFNGATWAALIPNDNDPDNAYDIRVAMANECSGNAGTSGLATNALNLGGVPADEYVTTGDSRLTDSRPCNNTFDNAATARAALSVLSQTEALSSPAFTGSPTCPTQSIGNNSTRVASTAFTQAAIALMYHADLREEEGYILFQSPVKGVTGLPSTGIIIQWGSCLGQEDAWGTASIRFHSEGGTRHCWVESGSYVGTNTHITVDLYSNSLFRVFSNAYPGNGYTGLKIRWIAIGH